MADSVKFKGSDLKTARTCRRAWPRRKRRRRSSSKWPSSRPNPATTGPAQAKQEEQAKHDKIAANKAAIAATNKRFGELGEYNILGEVTVLFANGKVAVDPQYKPQLLQLAQKAKTVDGYVIQVKGYASSVGSAAMNQKLSTERADNVTEFLEQQGGIPLTNMLAPGAMGTSKQVAPDTRKKVKPRTGV